MPTRYKWAHINDRSLKNIQAILPRAQVMSDGDCGSVWGEYHPGDKGESGPRCPHPHVLVKNPTKRDLWTLKNHGVRFYADPTEDWGEDPKHALNWRWIEDDLCVERETFPTDHRTPYGEPSRELVERN